MAATYEIVSQVPRTRMLPGGQYGAVSFVTFKTKPSGIIGTVDIPTQLFSVDEVDRVVSAQAQLLEQVQAL